ncbi:MAG TPA: type III PLP-dependent enzyme [Thermoflexales bacterium]|nr:type III PLP-dependent enzyme [Thermoflexales bacterium]
MGEVIEGSRLSGAHVVASSRARKSRTAPVVTFAPTQYPALPANHPLWQLPSPTLISSPKQAGENMAAAQRAFAFDGLDVNVGYAMKSNPHPALLSAVADQRDSWFEVASKAEISALENIGVGGDRIFFSNPIKQPAHIAHAVKLGVKLFVYDSEAELEKLAQFNDPSNPLEVYVRMTVSHTGALWPLTHKFGVEPGKAVQLLKLAKARGLKPVGMAFHVGSQCSRPQTWVDALRECAPAWAAARAEGLELDMIDIGGGFPTRYTGPVPTFSEVAQAVKPALDETMPGAKRLFIEPGRSICGNTTDMVLTVTGVAERPDGQTWLYLDGGYFQGLYEIPDGIRPAAHPVVADPRPINMVTYRLAGPTCDSLDTLFEMRSPVEMKIGDKIVLKNTGAYVYSVGSPFNGFALPDMLNADEWMINRDEFPGMC